MRESQSGSKYSHARLLEKQVKKSVYAYKCYAYKKHACTQQVNRRNEQE